MGSSQPETNRINCCKEAEERIGHKVYACLMEPKHVESVAELERLCFTVPWSAQAFLDELTGNPTARYIVAIFGKEVLMCLACLAAKIVEMAIYLQCHSGLARSATTTLAPLFNRHSALCAEFGVSAIHGDTHHNRCFATLAKSGAANEEVY